MKFKKKKLEVLVLSLSIMTTFGFAHGAQEKSPVAKNSTKCDKKDQFLKNSVIKHDFIAVDNGKNQLFRVNQFNNQDSWRIPLLKGSRDLQLIDDDKNILVSNPQGAVIYSIKDGKKVKVLIDSLKGVQSAVLHNEKYYFLGTANNITVADKNGNILKVIEVKEKLKSFRLMRFDKDGNIFIGADGIIVKIDLTGKVIRKIKLKGKIYVVKRNVNGDFLVTFGYEGMIAMVDSKTGKVKSFYGGKEKHPKMGIDFASGFVILKGKKDDTVVLCNWLGHGKQGKGMPLIEFNKENKVIWTWADHKNIKQVTNAIFLK